MLVAPHTHSDPTLTMELFHLISSRPNDQKLKEYLRPGVLHLPFAVTFAVFITNLNPKRQNNKNVERFAVAGTTATRVIGRTVRRQSL